MPPRKRGGKEVNLTYEEIHSSMRARYRELSGFDADQASDIGVRLKILAAETASAYEKLEELRAQVFPQTSSGEYLELHAQGRAITRKQAIAATGMLEFSRETPAYSDIPIPSGVMCATRPEPQVRFETVEDSVLPAGQTRVTVPAVAVDAGAQGNVAASAVCVMISPPAGITGVTNPEPFSGGMDEESDDALRSRLLAAYENISNGTNRAFYYDLAMSYDDVSSVNILPRRRGRGTVDVVIACRSAGTQAELVDAMQDDMNRRKEINVDVRVVAATVDMTAISYELAVKDGYNFELVAEKSREAVRDYVNSLSVGSPLLLAAVGNRLLMVDGVYNYSITSPNRDTIPSSDHVLRAGTISTAGMAVG